MLFHNFGSQILRQFFAPVSFLHAQCAIHRHTTQRLSQLLSILTGCKCDFYITSTCYLPQVSLNTNERSITFLKYNYFLQFWKGANHFVWSSVWTDSRFGFCSLLFFYFFFQCKQNKINKHVNTKAFVIATIFWRSGISVLINCMLSLELLCIVHIKQKNLLDHHFIFCTFAM